MVRTLNRVNILAALEDKLQGELRYHQMNIEVYLEKPVGIGEHSDVLGAIEEELDKIAEAHERMEMIREYFTDDRL